MIKKPHFCSFPISYSTPPLAPIMSTLAIFFLNSEIPKIRNYFLRGQHFLSAQIFELEKFKLIQFVHLFAGMHFSQAVAIIQSQVGVIRGVQVLYSDTVRSRQNFLISKTILMH